MAVAPGVDRAIAGTGPVFAAFLVPIASPPRLVVIGFYRYVRNPIYVGFMAVLIGQALLFGSSGLVELLD